LLEALAKRVNYFHDMGCRIADHGLESMPTVSQFSSELDTEFRNFLGDSNARFSNPDAFTGHILLQLCRMYHSHGWVQQFHLGAIRNNNRRLAQKIGPDSGFDSIGDYPQAQTLSAFLNALDQDNQLAKTILYNNNPANNEVFATMAGNFNDGSTRGKVQFGSAWWFLDQKDGIESQLNTLSTMGVLSTFVGMITDSRSFLSYSRQDYFRRVLCNLIGHEIETGLIPADEKLAGDLIRKVCYHNAREYFGIAPARSVRN
jgi:glucuronate isomerase